ncbi:MAG: Lin0512 family protein [Dehalococcoidia bacterium]|nr:Lin0512 family protein [Dehalococcoidia bacterium]
MRTFIVELGTGADLHGGDATTAALRAVQDCFNHVSLPGLFSVAGLKDPNEMEVEVILGVPAGVPPVDLNKVAANFPFGRVSVSVQDGGLSAPGGGREDDTITMVNAAVYVRVP